jgi:hypothetical protein
MSKRLFVVLAVATAVAAATIVAARSTIQSGTPEQIYAAGEQVSKRGIRTYYVTADANEVHARLADKNDDTVALFRATPITLKGVDTVELEWKGLNIKMVWDKGLNTAQVFKNGLLVGTTQAKQPNDSIRALMQENAEAFALLRDLINDFASHAILGHSKQSAKGPCGPKQQGNDAPTVGGPSGDGARRVEHGCAPETTNYRCELGWTRSGACQSATDTTNGDCSNYYCWGCCALTSDCDCICGADDFLCDCCRGGSYCTQFDKPSPVVGPARTPAR